MKVQIDSKAFDAHGAILRNLEFAAREGEFIALVGPSGAGKSTLLNILAVLDQDYSGSIHWDGDELGSADVSGPRLGMLFQEPRLMPWLSVLENISLVMPETPDRLEKASQLLADVGLSDWLNAWPNQLSGGMQRRVALARAFAVSPQLLLMDEPFVSLDLPTATRLRDALITLWEREKPLVVFVTHDLREALAMADRILFMSSSPASIVLDYKVPEHGSRHIESSEIAELQNNLLQSHPGLLSGLSGNEEGAQHDS